MAKKPKTRSSCYPKRNSSPCMYFFVEGAVTETEYIKDVKSWLLESSGLDTRLCNRIKQNILPPNSKYQNLKGMVDAALMEDLSENDICIIIADSDGKERSKEKEHIKEAIQKAKENNLDIVYSVPCFEFWALLHFKDVGSVLNQVDYQKELKRVMKGYDHSNDKRKLNFDLMKDNFEVAKRRAKASEKNGMEYCDNICITNPSTNAYLIVDKMKEFIKSFQENKCVKNEKF